MYKIPPNQEEYRALILSHVFFSITMLVLILWHRHNGILPVLAVLICANIFMSYFTFAYGRSYCVDSDGIRISWLLYHKHCDWGEIRHIVVSELKLKEGYYKKYVILSRRELNIPLSGKQLFASWYQLRPFSTYIFEYTDERYAVIQECFMSM